MSIDIYFAKVQISVHLQVDNISKMAQIQLPDFKVWMALETRFRPLGAMDLQKNDNQNIMLHIRVDMNCLTMNTKTNGSWGDEEHLRITGIGSSDTLLSLRVEARSEYFRVIVNRKDMYKYKHRFPLTDVNMCVISTDDIKQYTVFF